MIHKISSWFLLAISYVCFIGCGDATAALENITIVEEIPVDVIPLAGEVAYRKAEVSGIAWHGDTLVILPQYPELFPTDDGGSLFAIAKDDILAFLEGKSTEPLQPSVIPFVDQMIGESIAGFEGYEAIAFNGDQVFLTIEAETRQGMKGYLVTVEIQPDLGSVRLDLDSVQEIQPQTRLDNFSEEAILILEAAERLITMYEANGANVNPQPAGHIFNLDLSPDGLIDFPTIEYRITDVTSLDDQGRFWAINFLFSGDRRKLDPAEDQIRIEHGIGESHVESNHVERLVEFQFTEAGILISDQSPIYLELMDGKIARNWEGIVRLDDLGFLLMTDKHPGTILGFVPLPENPIQPES